MANIAEGYGRYHYLDSLRFYYIARAHFQETGAIRMARLKVVTTWPERPNAHSMEPFATSADKKPDTQPMETNTSQTPPNQHNRSLNPYSLFPYPLFTCLPVT